MDQQIIKITKEADFDNIPKNLHYKIAFCKKCGQWKKNKDFYNSERTGVYTCKSCFNQWRRNKYANNANFKILEKNRLKSYYRAQKLKKLTTIA